MLDKNTTIVIANFGGPREKQEIYPFLKSLLTDKDVIRTKIPNFLQKILFSAIAKRRSKKVVKDYETIGGKSPIYADTENLAYALSRQLEKNVLCFHRYLPDTHKEFFKKLESLDSKTIKIFPCFPQFCYATTGSIARLFEKKLSSNTVKKIRWIKSFAGHTGFISSYSRVIEEFMKRNNLSYGETFFLFSSHGIPQTFVNNGDIYQSECEMSYDLIIKNSPIKSSMLCYQSKFGPGKWLMPYTSDVCRHIKKYIGQNKNVVFVPLSFTSDHIETLFEIEKLYMPVITKRKINAYRCPALNLHPKWIASILEILQETNLMTNQMLIRK